MYHKMCSMASLALEWLVKRGTGHQTPDTRCRSSDSTLDINKGNGADGEESPGDSTSVEGKVVCKLGKDMQQLVAQTVVSSFTERRLHPKMNTMVPSILIDEYKFSACLYDAENDLLALMQKMNWREDELRLSKAGVTLLWTLLNHR